MFFNIWSECGAKFGASLEPPKLPPNFAPNSLQTDKNISFSNMLSMCCYQGLVWSEFGAFSPCGKNDENIEKNNVFQYLERVWSTAAEVPVLLQYCCRTAAELSHNCCRTAAEVLRAAVLQQFCGSSSAILQQFCSSSAAVLQGHERLGRWRTHCRKPLASPRGALPSHAGPRQIPWPKPLVHWQNF